MNKTVRFIQYINEECICTTFNSLNSAIKYVYEHEEWSGDFSNNKRKKISARIKASITSGISYCGGQWQIQEANK